MTPIRVPMWTWTRRVACLTLLAFAWASACPALPTAWAEQQYRTKVYYYHTDHLGSTNLVTDETGQVVQRIEYTPHGQPYRTTGQDVTSRKFTGKQLDASTGLYYYGARYYDPQLGRFIQPDSIVQAPADPQTLNRYTYARNNPLIYTDPTGHSFWKKVKKFFKAAAAIVIGVVVTIATGGFAAPAALAWGGFAAGFSGTLINGGSIGQAFGMGFVGAFAGGVGGVAFNGLKDFARIAALTGIGATAGAAGSAIMGGNIGLGAAAGAAAGFLGGAIGGRLADKWDPGLARTAAGMAAAAGSGAASAAIAGGSPGMGAGLGAFAVATAAAARNFQAMIDAGQKSGAAEGRTAAAGATPSSTRSTAIHERSLDRGSLGRTELAYELAGVEGVLRDAFQVDVSKVQFDSVKWSEPTHKITWNDLFELGKTLLEAKAATTPGWFYLDKESLQKIDAAIRESKE